MELTPFGQVYDLTLFIEASQNLKILFKSMRK